MTKAIRVPKGFVQDFKFYAERAGLEPDEVEYMRDAVRANFDETGRWVQVMAACYRFIDKTWGGKKPTSDQCRDFLAARGWHPEDESIFKRWGIMLQVRLCAEVAGAIPANLSKQSN